MLRQHSPEAGLNSKVCPSSGMISSLPRYQQMDGVGLPVTVAMRVAGDLASTMRGLRGFVNLGASPDSSFSVRVKPNQVL